MTLPEPPPGLPPPQATIWTDTTTRLHTLGIDTVDPRHLRAYTRTAHTLDQTTTLLDAAGPLIERDGHIAPNPAQATHRQAARDLARLATTLGLTRPAAAAVPEVAGQPMEARPHGQHDHWGARWCAEHNRWECTGQRNRGRGQCHKSAMAGLNTCNMHQGRNGRVKHLAAVAAMQGDVVAGPLPGGRALPDVHPADALLYQVRYWAGLCDWLNDVVAGLQQGTMVWGVTRETVAAGGEYPGTTTIRAAGLHAWVQWHERAHRQLASVCEIALRAEVDQAALALQQAQGMQAFRAYQTGLQGLDLSPGQWDKARAVMPKVLRALVAA